MTSRIQLAEIARRLEDLAHGERTRYAEQQAAFFGVSVQTLYRRLAREVGWTSGRKARADKGSTRASQDALRLAAALQREGMRRNGKSTMALTTAHSILAGNGVVAGVSVPHMQRLMRARKLDRVSQTRDTPHVTMRAEHPNHLHQVDPSLCVVYYLRGEQRIMREDAFYKNKLEAFSKVRFKTWRYVLWDAASSAIKVRYFQATGETQKNLAEFLLWAWSTGAQRPPYGVPRLLGLDPGSANTAHAVRALCAALEVEPVVHLPGAARVNGGVENAQNIVETQFESRLRFEPVDSVEQLNAAVEHWCHAWNEDLIPGMSTQLVRRGMKVGARAHLWRLIREDQLRFLPPIEVCRALMEGRTIERKVHPGLTITFKHPQAKAARMYSVRGLDGVCVGDMVHVSPLVFGDCAIRVRVPIFNGEDRVYRIEPEPQLDQWGQPIDAPVWGQSYHALPKTLADQQADALDALAYPGLDREGIRKARNETKTPLRGALQGKDLSAHSYLASVNLPASMPKRGGQIDVPDYATPPATPPLSAFAAAHAIASLIERALTAEENALLRAWYPDGVDESKLRMLAECIRSGTVPFDRARPAARTA